MGGLVTSHGAGMSVPDWPNSYGYNMFLFPPRLWIGGILYEHTHRLMATVVGMFSIALAIAAWKSEPRRWARWLAYSVLGAVIFQGVLGGLRVVLVKLDLAIVHACVAQAFFCLATLGAIVTSRWWKTAPDFSTSEDRPRGAAWSRLVIACVIAIYAQLIVGATMRHFDAGLAIPDLPLAYGKLLPPTNSAQLAPINSHRAFDLNLKPVTLDPNLAPLRPSHRRVRGDGDDPLPGNDRSSDTIGGSASCWLPQSHCSSLLLAQLTLGVLTVLLRKPADIASLHVAVGALVLVTTFVLAIRSMRLYSHLLATPQTPGLRYRRRPGSPPGLCP